MPNNLNKSWLPQIANQANHMASIAPSLGGTAQIGRRPLMGHPKPGLTPEIGVGFHPSGGLTGIGSIKKLGGGSVGSHPGGNQGCIQGGIHLTMSSIGRTIPPGPLGIGQ